MLLSSCLHHPLWGLKVLGYSNRPPSYSRTSRKVHYGVEKWEREGENHEEIRDDDTTSTPKSKHGMASLMLQFQPSSSVRADARFAVVVLVPTPM